MIFDHTPKTRFLYQSTPQCLSEPNGSIYWTDQLQGYTATELGTSSRASVMVQIRTERTAKSCMFCTSRIDLVICRNLKYPAHILACKHCMCCTESGDADVTQHTPIMKEKMYIIAPPSLSCVATMCVHLF